MMNDDEMTCPQLFHHINYSSEYAWKMFVQIFETAYIFPPTRLLWDN